MTETIPTPLANLSWDVILTLVFLGLVVLFMIHSAVVTYHWVTYAKNRAQAFTAAVIHIGVGVLILITMGGIILF